MTLTPLTLTRRIDAQLREHTEQHADTASAETKRDTFATVRLTHESYDELHDHAQTKRALAARIASLCSCSVSIQRAPAHVTSDTISFGEESIPLVE